MSVYLYRFALVVLTLAGCIILALLGIRVVDAVRATFRGGLGGGENYL